MAWFFTDFPVSGENYVITGENARHIEKSLRMKIGESLTLVDNLGMQYSCHIDKIISDTVTVKIDEKFVCQNEPTVSVTLYQALPKGDKMDFIVQKAVELGVTEIVPVVSARCISRPDEKSLNKKIQRWNKIALQAAQQSRRGIVPKVRTALSFQEAVSQLNENDCNIIFYECGGKKTGDIIPSDVQHINMFIGSEGGFEEYEVNAVVERGGNPATLGKRVLRAETAPLCAVSVIMYLTGNI